MILSSKVPMLLTSIIAKNVSYLHYTEDLKRLNDKLVETNTIKMELQLKLDELQSSEISIQVNSDSHLLVILSLQ